MKMGPTSKRSLVRITQRQQSKDTNYFIRSVMQNFMYGTTHVPTGPIIRKWRKQDTFLFVWPLLASWVIIARFQSRQTNKSGSVQRGAGQEEGDRLVPSRRLVLKMGPLKADNYSILCIGKDGICLQDVLLLWTMSRTQSKACNSEIRGARAAILSS